VVARPGSTSGPRYELILPHDRMGAAGAVARNFPLARRQHIDGHLVEP
jgi:hypothetical protein